MRRWVLGAALAVAALAAAPGSAGAADPPFINWNPLLPGVSGPYKPSRETSCRTGSRTCIELTLGQMYHRFDTLYASCDPNAAFGITYIRVTEAIRKSILRGTYAEPDYLSQEDRGFARMYFKSFDLWKAGKRDRVPKPWLIALDTGKQRTVNGLGNLLLSMNAHINRDFPYLLESLGLNNRKGQTRKPDHDRGNPVLNTLYDDVLKELAARFDPVVSSYDVPGVAADDTAIFQILQGWRELAWRHAEMLAAAKTPAQRKNVSSYIENYAIDQANLIRAGTTIKSSAARDAHCAAYRRTHREHGGQARTAKPHPDGKVPSSRVSRSGRLKLRARCPQILRDCAGTVTLVRNGRKLGSRRIGFLAYRHTKVLRLKLNRQGRRALRRARRHRITVSAVSASPSPWGTTRRKALPLRLRLRR